MPPQPAKSSKTVGPPTVADVLRRFRSAVARLTAPSVDSLSSIPPTRMIASDRNFVNQGASRRSMTYLVGLVVAFLLFGGLELSWRSIGLPLSVFGALGAVLRQTDEPWLQRRQALTMLLLAVGGGMLI